MAGTPAAAPASILPSPASLGRAVRVLNAAYYRLDEKKVAAGPGNGGDIAARIQKDEAVSLAVDREYAARHLALILPAVTLEDVAHQLAMADDLLDSLGDGDGTNDFKESVERLGRAVASMLPVVCAAAGLDVAAVGFVGQSGRCASRMSAEVPA